MNQGDQSMTRKKGMKIRTSEPARASPVALSGWDPREPLDDVWGHQVIWVSAEVSEDLAFKIFNFLYISLTQHLWVGVLLFPLPFCSLEQIVL